MRKKIIIYAIILFVLSFVFALFFYDDFNPVKVTAVELAKDYNIDKSAADKKYLDKTIILTGNVKAYYRLLGARHVLELETGDSKNFVFCFFIDQRNEYEAGLFNEGEKVELKVKCVGINSYSYVKGIKVEVKKIIN